MSTDIILIAPSPATDFDYLWRAGRWRAVRFKLQMVDS